MFKPTHKTPDSYGGKRCQLISEHEGAKWCLWEDGCYRTYLANDLEPIPEEPAAPVFQVGDVIFNRGAWEVDKCNPIEEIGTVTGFQRGGMVKYTELSGRKSQEHPSEIDLIYRPQAQKPDLYEWMPSAMDLGFLRTGVCNYWGSGGSSYLSQTLGLIDECIKRRSGQ